MLFFFLLSICCCFVFNTNTQYIVFFCWFESFVECFYWIPIFTRFTWKSGHTNQYCAWLLLNYPLRLYRTKIAFDLWVHTFKVGKLWLQWERWKKINDDHLSLIINSNGWTVNVYGNRWTIHSKIIGFDNRKQYFLAFFVSSFILVCLLTYLCDKSVTAESWEPTARVQIRNGTNKKRQQKVAAITKRHQYSYTRLAIICWSARSKQVFAIYNDLLNAVRRKIKSIVVHKRNCIWREVNRVNWDRMSEKKWVAANNT